MTGVFGLVVQCVFVFSCVQLVLWLSYLVCIEMRYSIILLLSVCYINCYKDITPKRHKGLCQISLNGTDSKEYNFDLSRYKYEFNSCIVIKLLSWENWMIVLIYPYKF